MRNSANHLIFDRYTERESIGYVEIDSNLVIFSVSG